MNKFLIGVLVVGVSCITTVRVSAQDIVVTDAERAALAALAERQASYLGNFWFEDGFVGGQGTIATRTDWFWQAHALERLGNQAGANAYLEAMISGQLGQVPPGGPTADLRLPMLLVGSSQLVAAIRQSSSGFLAGLLLRADREQRRSLVDRMGYAIRWKTPDGAWTQFQTLATTTLTRYGYRADSNIIHMEHVLPPLFAELSVMTSPLHPELFVRMELWNHGREALETELVSWLLPAGQLYRAAQVDSATGGQMLTLTAPGAPPLHYASETPPSVASTTPMDGLSGDGLPSLPALAPRLWKYWRGTMHPTQRHIHRERVSLAERSGDLTAFPEELSFEDPYVGNYAVFEMVQLTEPGVFTADPLLNTLYARASVVHSAARDLDDIEPAADNLMPQTPEVVARQVYESVLRPIFRRPNYGQPLFDDVTIMSGQLRISRPRERQAFLEAARRLPGVAWDVREQTLLIGPERVAYPAWHPLAGRHWSGVAGRRLVTPAALVSLCYTDEMRQGRVELLPRRDAFMLALSNRIEQAQQVTIAVPDYMQLVRAGGDPMDATDELSLSLAPRETLRLAVEPRPRALDEATQAPSPEGDSAEEE